MPKGCKPITTTCDTCGVEFLYMRGPSEYKKFKKHFCSDCWNKNRDGLNVRHGYAARDENGQKDQRYVMWEGAKRRARKKGIPFNISVEDIIIPETCPVFGFPLTRGNDTPLYTSPSLDRIIPEKGYVKGNIVVISHKANKRKSNATIAELIKLADFYKNFQ